MHKITQLLSAVLLIVLFAACNNHHKTSMHNTGDEKSFKVIIDSSKVDSIVYNEQTQNMDNIQSIDTLSFLTKDSIHLTFEGRLNTGRIWTIKDVDEGLSIRKQSESQKTENHKTIDYQHFIFDAESFGVYNILFEFNRTFVKNDTTAIPKNIVVIADSTLESSKNYIIQLK